MARAVSSCLLEWDSRFLGLPVGRITDAVVSDSDLATALEDQRARGIALVYWAASAEPGADLVRRFGGRLVDRKITWTCDLASLDVEAGATAVVQPYAPWMPTAALEDLAVQSAAFSRFRVDPHMPAWAADALYRTWMRRALAADLADIVLVAREATRIAGVVTVGEAGGDAAVGLLAVDAGARGRGHGQALVAAAQRWAHLGGNPTLRVVTQAANLPACRLYERCGFRVATIACFYHFWLRPSPASRNA